MRNYLRIIRCLIFIAFLSACKKQPTTLTPPPLNDYVAEYTTGVNSRKSSIEMLLNDALPEEQQKPEFLKKAFSISPKAEGKLAVLEDRRLTFQPSGMLQPGTVYTVTWDLSKFFKTPEQQAKFSFSIKTIEPAVSFKLNELDINSHTTNDTIYEFKASVLLSDWSDSTTVYNLIGFDKPVNVVWEKIKEGKKFDLTFSLREQPKTARTLEVFTKKNNQGYAKQQLAKIDIPGKNDFDVYDICSVTEGGEYIQVTFTRNLDPDQDFNGLVEVEPGNDISYSVEENKLNVWLQDKSVKERVVTVHDGIMPLFKNRTFKKNEKTPRRYKRTINFQNNYPALEFIGEGSILPESESMLIPFRATSLRGVIVRVIKVYENNMGQFLQNNQISEGYGLAGVGELLCRKIIFLDEQGNYDLLNRNTFALDLKKLITPEPGALYRVILSYNFELSSYPCEGVVKMTKKDLIEENRKLEEQEIAEFGNGNAYYYFSDQNWQGYNWKDRDDPCTVSYYVNKQIAKNVLQSNLGILAKKGDRGKMFVSVNNVVTGKPEGEVSVSIYTFQNQEIGTKTTWDNGTIEFETAGKEPYYLIARKGNQRGYLRIAPADALSMSAFNVSGEEVKNGTKGFIYTERGVWRPGDTLFVSFILNNMYNDLPERHPVTFELFNPAGQLYWRKSQTTRSDNFYVFKPVTAPNAPTGVWTGKVTVGGISFEKKLRIETIKPNRLSIDLSFENEILQRDEETEAVLKAQWLTGAIAKNLKYDIYTTFVPMETSFSGWKGYVFDNPARKFTANDVLFSKGSLNQNGEVRINTKMTQGGFAPGFVRTQFLTKVYEESGEFSINSIQKVYSPFKSYVGIYSPQKEEEPLLTGKSHLFNFATLLPNGKPIGNRKIKVQLYKVLWYWWWNSDESQIANYISSNYNQPIKTFYQTSNEKGKGTITMKVPNVEWGTYFIQLTDTESGHSSACMAYFDNNDWNERNPNGSDKSMLLALETDKESYTPGEDITVRFPSTSESRAVVTVEASGGILEHYEIECQAKQTAFTFKASANMQPNIYVSVTLLNPYASTKHDLPIRLYGVIPIKVQAADSRLTPRIETVESVRPDTKCSITVSEQHGFPMTFTLGVVDEGLLELTNFKTPSPWDAFFAKEALGMRTWDIYNYVLGAYGGKIDQIFSIGGDDALNRGPKAIVNRFKPVVRFMGPYTLKANEKRTLSFTMPEYIGKVRCMVIAGNAHQYGCAQKDIFVRQPLMVLGTLPRKLAPDDEIWLPATVFAMKKDLGKVNVSLEVNDAFCVIGKQIQEVNFSKEGNKVVWFRIKANRQLEEGRVRITVNGNGEKANWESNIAIYSPMTPISKTENMTLKSGESKSVVLTPFGMKGSNKGNISVSGIQLLNLNNRINYLVNYPYECLEQILSKAFALIYLPKIAKFSPAEEAQMEEIVRSVNMKIKNYMVPGGGFALWPGNTSVCAWTSVYAFIYLNEVARSGFILSHGLRHETGQYLARIAREWKPMDSSTLALDQITQAFRLYALAQAQIPEKGAMNRLRQTENLSVGAKWLLAGAYAFENKEIGRQIIESIGNTQETYSSMPFVNALQLMALEGVGYEQQAHNMVQVIIKNMQSDILLNTSENAFSLIGLCNYYEKYPPVKSLDFDLSIDGNIESVNIPKMVWDKSYEDLDKKQKIQITNKSEGTIYLQYSVTGIPNEKTDFETSNGILLKAVYTTLEGAIINETNLEQGVNFIYKIKVTNTAGVTLRNIMLDQQIPAGWEIINMRMYRENNKYPIGVTYQDIRDDKVASYIQELPTGQSIEIPIYLTAAYAGEFYQPAATAGDMYSLQFNASTEGKSVTVRKE